MPLDNPILGAALNHISLDQIKEEKGPPPWAHQVVLADHVCAFVICQEPDQVNDRHCHDYDEWWVVLEGEIDWTIEGREDQPVKARAGDFVLVPSQTFHQIRPGGDSPSVRLAIALPGHGHLEEKPERKARVRIE